MLAPFFRKLEHGAALSDTDRRSLERSVRETREVGPRADIIREGARPDDVYLVLTGLACRYKLLEEGQRQIMAFLIPGDMCDLHVAILGRMDHAIGTLAPSKVAYIPQQAIQEITTKHPNLNRALWWNTLVDEATLREWLVSMGRRPADKRLAHLCCELLVRMRSVGLADGNTIDLPLTQDDLADTLGISTVHVNRVLQQLRDDGLITFRDKKLTVHDVPRLQAFSGFDPNYLHLDNRRGNGGASVPMTDASGPG